MSTDVPGGMDPYIWGSVDRYAAAGMRIPCLLQGRDDLLGSAGDVARALGVEFGSRMGTIYTAFLPADRDKLRAIAALSEIWRFEASR